MRLFIILLLCTNTAFAATGTGRIGAEIIAQDDVIEIDQPQPDTQIIDGVLVFE